MLYVYCRFFQTYLVSSTRYIYSLLKERPDPKRNKGASRDMILVYTFLARRARATLFSSVRWRSRGARLPTLFCPPSNLLRTCMVLSRDRPGYQQRCCVPAWEAAWYNALWTRLHLHGLDVEAFKA